MHFSHLKNPGEERTSILKLPAGLEKQHFHVTGKKSIMRFAVFFHVFMLSMKVNSIVILNFIGIYCI